MGSKRAKLVSFSGIDGAGKSTQIDALLRQLEASSRSYRLFTFWDDVVAFSRLRERMSLRVFKGDKGVGTPEKPIVRRDKNVTSWYATISRLFFYALDAGRLNVILSTNARGGADFVIFDRYIYDELANLPLQNRLCRFYVQSLLKLIPRPDVAFLLDADPVAAATRKPEYPLDFVRRNRSVYLRLAQLAGMTVVPPLSQGEASQFIMQSISRCCLQTEVGPRTPLSTPLPRDVQETSAGSC